MLFTKAILLLLLLHTPPGVASLNWVVAEAQIVVMPVIGATACPKQRLVLNRTVNNNNVRDKCLRIAIRFGVRNKAG